MLKRKASGATGGGKLPEHDPQTGLATRLRLRAWAEEGAARARATSERMAIVFVGIRNLQEVNDTYGPDLGDRVIVEVVRRLVDALGKNARLSRYAGAELVAVLDGFGTTERANDLGHELLAHLNEPLEVDGLSVPIFSMIGVALSDPGYADEQAWIDDAHDALAKAREGGSGAVIVHDESTRNRIDTQINDERVRRAFENDEFVMVYQPIVTPHSGAVVGFESLLRWLDPGSGVGLISPGQFLPLLEKTGLITPVGTWAIEQSARQIHEWNARDPEASPFFVSVNLGARQLAQTSFAESVASALDRASLRPELLTLDLTPEAIKYNKSATWSALRDLKYLGVRIALDDFGVGDSSMAYLREIQVDLLRIDRMFVDGLGQTREDEAIVRSIIGLGHDLEILTLAEGVENEHQAETLRDLSCPLAQGWHYGRPELAHELESSLFGATPA